MDAHELNNLLKGRMADMVSYLYPAAKKKSGGVMTIGSLSGEAGDSFQIYVEGSKVGMWIDRANDSDKGGSPLWLWAKAKGLEYREAIEQAKEWAGVRDVVGTAVKRHTPKVYAKPDKAGIKIAESKTAVTSYLVDVRKVDPLVVAAHKIAEKNDGKTIVFPYIDEKTGVAVHFKFLDIERKEGKKVMSASKGTKRTLFGKQTIKADSSYIVIAEGECYSSDTQIMTQRGWVYFPDLLPTDLVMQYNDDKSCELVEPTHRIIKDYEGDMVHIETPQVDLLVTPNHRIIGERRGNKVVCLAKDVWSQLSVRKSGVFCGGSGIPLSDDQIKFCIAISADAKIDTRKNTGNRKSKEKRYAHFGLKKQRKKDRLESLITKLGLDCLITHGKGSDGGYSYYSMSIPDWVCGRLLPHDWLTNATIAQRNLILDELIHWDGNSVPNRNQKEYSSKHAENAEFVQALMALSGYASTIMDRSNEFGEWKKVSMLYGKSTACVEKRHKKSVKYTGKVYCVTVPSGMILVRRNTKFVVCGNCDSMSWQSYGIPAVSVPNGVSDMEWIDIDWEWLAGFEKIYVATDMDGPGREAAEKIAKRLGMHRCYITDLPQGKKDANDCLTGGVKREDMLAALEAAKQLEVDEMKCADCYAESVWDMYDTTKGEQGVELPWKGLNFRLRPGELTVLSGFSGHGKTLAINHLMLHAMQQGWNVMDASLEVTPAKTLQIMTRLALAKREPESKDELFACIDFIGKGLWFYELVGVANADRLLEVFTYARKRHGIDLFVIDSLFKMDVAADDWNKQREFMSKLTAFVNSTGAHVILVAHTKKMEKGEEKVPSKDGIAGSQDINNAAYNVLIVWRNKMKRRRIDELKEGKDIAKIMETEKLPDGRIRLDKQRFGTGEDAEVKIWFDPVSWQFQETQGKRIPYMVFDKNKNPF